MRASPRRIVVPPDADIHPVDRHVGRQIRLLRIHYNLSQGDLGRRIGLSYQQMHNYETGKNRAGASLLYEIARFLQVSPTRFFDGLPEPGATDAHKAAAEIDERLAYFATTDGRQLIENMLRLSPRLRNRITAIAAILADEQSDVRTPDT
jgi:transcriptional regulator with XRE-family HTH domain